MSLRAQPNSENITVSSATPILLQLPRPLLDYRTITAPAKGDVGAINTLDDALTASRDLNLPNPLLALGPTSPLSFEPLPAARILGARFTDNYNPTHRQRLTIPQPNHLTDISLNLEKFSKTRNGHIPVILRNFLDNLSASTPPARLHSFLSRLLTRIRTNEHAAFLLATDDMHDTKKTAILNRLTDLTIEDSAVEDMAEARILSHPESVQPLG